MTDFTVYSIENAPEGSRETLEQTRKAYGFVPNLMGVLAGAPAAAKAYAAVGAAYSEATLTPVEQQIVLLTASFENRCDYCMAAHSVVAKGIGAEDDVIAALRDGKSLADPRHEALRVFTRQIVEKRGWLDPAQVRAFVDAGFSQAQVLEVLTGVTLKTLSNYTNHLAQTPLDDVFASAEWSHHEAAAAVTH